MGLTLPGFHSAVPTLQRDRYCHPHADGRIEPTRMHNLPGDKKHRPQATHLIFKIHVLIPRVAERACPAPTQV